MMRMARIAKKFFDSMPADDFNMMAKLITSNQFSEIPLVRSVVDRYLNTPNGSLGGLDRRRGSEAGSLFNFGALDNVSQGSAGGFSFAMNSTFSGI